MLTARLGRSLLLVSLAAPIVMIGCSAPAEEASGSSDEAFTRKTIHEGATLRVTASQLNLREDGSASARIVGVLARDQLVTCVADSGSNGWVNVRTEDGDEGWAELTYLAETEQTDGTEPTGDTDTGPVDGATCSPERGTNAVSRFEKALHDTIA